MTEVIDSRNLNGEILNIQYFKDDRGVRFPVIDEWLYIIGWDAGLASNALIIKALTNDSDQYRGVKICLSDVKGNVQGYFTIIQKGKLTE